MPDCVCISRYGLSEIGGVSCAVLNEIGSVGPLMRGVEVKIIRDKTGEKCGIGEEG